MATAGPNAPGTLVSDSSVGAVAWSNPGNAAASDGSYATAVIGAAVTPSEYLKVTNFGFAIPAGATIDGITVAVERSSSQANRVNDSAVRIVKGGTIGSTDKGSATNWPTSDASVNYGGVSDLWGETWAYSDINASTFGMAISAASTGSGTRAARIDLITITVTYTEAAGGGQPPRTMHQTRMRRN
jgi:hypothetical protein